MKLRLPKGKFVNLYTPEGRYIGNFYTKKDCVFDESELQSLPNLWKLAVGDSTKGFDEQNAKIYCYEIPIPVFINEYSFGLEKNVMMKWFTFNKDYTQLL